MLTTFDQNEYVYEAMKAGASGFLLKDVRREELVNAVRVVAAGDALLAPAHAPPDRGLRAPAPPRGRRPRALAELTEREREVLRLVARGLSNAEIAAELVVSEATVKTHVARILSKLGLRDRIQAVVLAYESGFVQPGGVRACGGSPRTTSRSSTRRGALPASGLSAQAGGHGSCARCS